ncbi:hypothetical protein Agabi119p4_8687 [Agaricus bisporus var. burnettii]|uniref:Trafficking protein particle complex II-specific subunit 65 IgD3 domain-containing protein n=1 Tax=Agaricus bisporus var. burnettii TaxID=192524 RepID=A0A8H7C5U1_AGABI|nr:hypothetical protein Agabi119p4_8687 [Agaricus bisporus var. burnettii]
MSLEHLFASSKLAVVIPDTSVVYPPTQPIDEWLQILSSNTPERKQAFFDEQLQSLLTLRIEHPTPNEPANPAKPPPSLIDFLAHIQISLEASYISSEPIVAEVPQSNRLSAPPRTASLGVKASPRLGAHHPSIFPPTTPHPTPATTEHDKKYVASQGIPLFTSIWGQNPSDSSREDFSLVWSDSEQLWVAIYRLALTVSFLRLSFTDPLLCLTISATLREKPITSSSTEHPLIRFLKTYDDVDIPESPKAFDQDESKDKDDNINMFEEVNLLEGLLAGPTFSKMGPAIDLPSTRLGTVSRQKYFHLPPVNLPAPTAPSPSPATARGKSHPTLRKSYRKTLETASGFRVRMRTVFVPSIVLSSSQEEYDKVAAGNERTVVLCVEIENSGESGQGVGFEVERVDVSISGDEAMATLITWGQDGFTAKEAVFPLKIAESAQYNLLYAVTFLRSPEELDGFSFSRTTGAQPPVDLHRVVSINIHGKPYTHVQESLLYPTQTFSSKWSCILDLSTQQPQNPSNLDPVDPSNAHPSVLPEPPSPFPVLGLQSGKPTPPTPTSGNLDVKSSQLVAGRILKSSKPRISSVPIPARSSTPSHVQSHYIRSSTTYSAPPIPLDNAQTPPIFDLPITPAYPSFPSSKSAIPPTPMGHAPIISQTSVGLIGPNVEARRWRGSTTLGGGVEPPTPVPHQYDTGGFANEQQRVLMRQTPTHEFSDNNSESIVVSVGLLDVIKSGGVGPRKEGREEHEEEEEEEEVELGPGRIYPLDSFTLDIFVFNKSEKIKRFEISCFERRRRRGGGEQNQSNGGGGGGGGSAGGAGGKMGYPGILPMESRVRIGPLLPSACQSVRMEFLAVSPGVHSIEALTLKDIESGQSVNLRSVMDIVVHEPQSSEALHK